MAHPPLYIPVNEHPIIHQYVTFAPSQFPVQEPQAYYNPFPQPIHQYTQPMPTVNAIPEVIVPIQVNQNITSKIFSPPIFAPAIANVTQIQPPTNPSSHVPQQIINVEDDRLKATTLQQKPMIQPKKAPVVQILNKESTPLISEKRKELPPKRKIEAIEIQDSDDEADLEVFKFLSQNPFKKPQTKPVHETASTVTTNDDTVTKSIPETLVAAKSTFQKPDIISSTELIVIPDSPQKPVKEQQKTLAISSEPKHEKSPRKELKKSLKQTRTMYRSETRLLVGPGVLTTKYPRSKPVNCINASKSGKLFLIRNLSGLKLFKKSPRSGITIRLYKRSQMKRAPADVITSIHKTQNQNVPSTIVAKTVTTTVTTTSDTCTIFKYDSLENGFVSVPSEDFSFTSKGAVIKNKKIGSAKKLATVVQPTEKKRRTKKFKESGQSDGELQQIVRNVKLRTIKPSLQNNEISKISRNNMSSKTKEKTQPVVEEQTKIILPQDSNISIKDSVDACQTFKDSLSELNNSPVQENFMDNDLSTIANDIFGSD